MNFLCLWLTSFIFFEKQKRITDTTHFMIEHQPFYSLSQFNLSQNQNILLLICEGSEPDFFPSLQHYLSIPKKYLISLSLKNTIEQKKIQTILMQRL